MQTQARHQNHDWRRTLVLPSELREPLAELARANERSTSAEIRVALRRHVRAAEHAVPRLVADLERLAGQDDAA